MATGTTQRPKRSTIEDVAAAAGVSVATVSRALRGLPNVAISTRHHVEEVATRLEYTADPAASRLAAGRTHTITVAIPHLSGWYFSTVVAGIEAVCAEAGYDVLVLGVGTRSGIRRLLSEAHALERRSDGLIAIDLVISEQEVASITARGVLMAAVGSTDLACSSVRIDNEDVGRIAADHLIDFGHTRLGIISGMNDDPMNFAVPDLRFSGFAEATRARGIAFDASLVEGGNFGVDGGQEAMAALLDRDEPPTAVFAMSDEMAFGALIELKERGLVAGTDVSIMGVDDHEFSRVVDLTTIHQPVADHGSTVARLLLDALQSGGDAPVQATHVVAPIELVVRSTTGRIRTT